MNHFIEIGVTPEGNYAFTIHTGSRNLGIKVWAYWSRRAEKGEIDRKELKARQRIIRETTKDKSKIAQLCFNEEAKMRAELKPTGYLYGEDLKGYITDMVITQAYAKFNHIFIAQKISAIFKKINGAKVIEEIRSTHNYIDMEDHIIRKGAIRSYLGEKVVIPFNMRDGLAICSGKSNEDWNYSAPHGSGRVMSRSKAKELLSTAEFQKQMEGIYSTSIGKGTIDESPMAYKETAEIVKLLEPSCEILYFIKPVISMKALNSMED